MGPHPPDLRLDPSAQSSPQTCCVALACCWLSLGPGEDLVAPEAERAKTLTTPSLHQELIKGTYI